MNRISHIRAKLGVTQQALAGALKVSQGNVSHYERGQNVPPEVAKRLISFASGRGLVLSFDDIYGAPTTSPNRRASNPIPASTTTGRTPASPHNILDTVPEREVIAPPGDKA